MTKELEIEVTEHGCDPLHYTARGNGVPIPCGMGSYSYVFFEDIKDSLDAYRHVLKFLENNPEEKEQLMTRSSRYETE